MRISIGDVRLFFDVEGAKYVPDGTGLREKPTLLLLHGGPGWDHSTFKPGFSALSDVAQIVYLEHRGNGRSDRSTATHWNLAQWGDDVVRFCDALEIRKPYVLGSSFGGTVAMSYATRHPEHPGKLILTNTTAKRRPELILAAFERLGGPAAREAASAYLNTPGPQTYAAYLKECHNLYGRRPMTDEIKARVIQNPDVIYHYSHGPRAQDGDTLEGEAKRFDFLPTLSRVQCPTLVLAGTDDPITPYEGARQIVSALPPSLVQLESFEGCGHTLLWDDPERFFRVIRDFIVRSDEAR